MVNHELEFAEVVIRGLESKVLVKATRTIVQAKLNDLTIEDLTENTLFPRILTIEDDKVFDLKVSTYSFWDRCNASLYVDTLIASFLKCI